MSLNERLREPGDIDVAASRTLGLYVVARLASRHGIVVRLVAGEPNGTVAQVDLPAHLVVSPLDTTDGVMPARIASRPPSPLLGGIPIEEQVRRAVEQSPAPRPTEPSFRSPPSLRSDTTVAVEAAGAAGPNRSTVWSVRTDSHTRTPRSYDEVERQPERSLRAPEPPLPPRPTLRSTRRCGRPGSAGAGGPIDWSSPADEGWRRAAAALRTAEEAASAAHPP